MARLDQRELAAVRWLIGQVLVLISLAGSYSLDLGADVLVTASIGLVLASCFVPHWTERIPRWFWRFSPLVLIIFIVSDFVLSGGDFFPPLFRMVLLLTLYRGLQVRTMREDLQLLLLTLFLLMVTGVLSQEITFGLQLLAYAPLAMGLLFAVNLACREKDGAGNGKTEPVFSSFSWLRLYRRFRDRFDRRTLLAGVLLFLGTTGMSLLFFLFMPRFDIGAALPFPRLQTDRSLTGFSDHVQYGDVVSILNDDTIAMRVDVESEDPPARPYWRMVVLDSYYDGGFMVSPKVARLRRTLQHYRFDFAYPGKRRETNESVWTLYLEGGISSYLPTGDTYDTLRFKNRTALQIHDLTRVLQGTEINATTLSLRYEDLSFGGFLPFGDEDGLLAGMEPLLVDTSEATYLKDVAYPQTLLVVPEGEANRRILDAVLEEIGFARGMPVGEFADRLVRFLRVGRGYSLESRVPGGEGETLLRWVDSGIPGHCELYAGAFVLISRYAGYPARLVTGYAGGDWNGYENYYMVRNRHAHAWCELFVPKRGWLRVDPTPGYGVDPGSVEDALAGGRLRSDRTWQAWLDSLRILWFRRVIQFDSEDQAVMAEVVKETGLLGLEGLKTTLTKIRTLLKKDWEAIRESGEWGGLVRDFMAPALALCGLLAAMLFLRRRHRRKQFEEIMRRRAGTLIQLRRLRGLPSSGQVHECLQLIRYGPRDLWPANLKERLSRSEALKS
ncbi:MAG: transglutaminaseTgpA domain-containing protein [Oceanipulchritudo sp.]